MAEVLAIGRGRAGFRGVMATSAHLYASVSLRARPWSWLQRNQGVPAISVCVCTQVSERAYTGNRSRAAASGPCMSRYQQLGKTEIQEQLLHRFKSVRIQLLMGSTLPVCMRSSLTRGALSFSDRLGAWLGHWFCVCPIALCIHLCCVAGLAACKYVHRCCLDMLCVNVSTGKTVSASALVAPGSIKPP